MKQDFISRNPALIAALGAAVDCEFDHIPIVEHEFSLEFERKMERLIQAESKPYYRFTNTRAKRVMLAFAATFILLTTMVFSVSAIREPFIRFIVETYEKFTSVLFRIDDPDVTLPTTIKQSFMPQWFPEGYTLDEAQSLTTDFHCFYAWSNGNETITYAQYVIMSTQLQVDTEGVEQTHAVISGHAGIAYSNKGIQNLVWNNGQYGFSLAGPVPLEDLLRVAESLREK